jgi:uncharacterized delta-60 repeat protein
MPTAQLPRCEGRLFSLYSLTGESRPFLYKLSFRSSRFAWEVTIKVCKQSGSIIAACMFIAFAFFICFAGAARAQTVLDGFDPNANGTIQVVVVQPDGKILIGGEFTTLSPNGGAAVTRNHIARLNSDGTLDTAFNPNITFRNGPAFAWVYAIALQADGKILVGGKFEKIGEQPRYDIARLDPVTGAADSWAPNANSQVRAIAVQRDGKILVGGFFNNENCIGGKTRNYIARLDAKTGAADSWNPNASGAVRSIAVQADGRVLVGGQFNGPHSIGGQTRNYIARLDALTGMADSFDPSANNTVYSITVQKDGHVLAGGDFTVIGGQSRISFARLDPITGLDDSFKPGVCGGGVYAIVVQSDGKILVGGAFFGRDCIGGQSRAFIARLDPMTGLADKFNPNAAAGFFVLSIAVQADGKILAGGKFTRIGGTTRNNIAQF